MSRVERILTFLIFLLFLFVSCEKSCNNDKGNEVMFTFEEVPYDNTSQFISVLSSVNWVILIECEGGGEWCQVNPSSGKGDKNNIILKYDCNKTDTTRKAKIQFVFSDNDTIVKYLTQNPKSDEAENGGDSDKPDSLVSDSVNNWMELPEVNITDGFAYVSHTAELTNDAGSKIVRNYSIYYDVNNKISLWVAYPLCKDYLGGQKRTDAWGYDPKIPSQYQPQLNRGWGVWGYDRGHQIPSGSRTSSRALNAQTFYFTNMTAQASGLNRGIWAETEKIVRGYASICDTLYVVTGPVLATKSDPTMKYIEDNAGEEVAVPKAYFKVVLGYTVSNHSYKSIGFWLENRDYYKSQPDISDLHTVTEIEKLTGIKFFDNLPDDIEDSIKNQFEPSKWGF